jgi:signal transduction histidine kinase
VINEYKSKVDISKKEFEILLKKNKILEEQNINLKDLNEDKNSVIEVVSHDLKAPLNRVFALSNLIYLSSENLTEEQLDYLDKMNTVIRDGLDLIRNLLDIRAIEFKGVQMTKEEVNLWTIILNLVRSYTPYSKKKGQSFDVVKISGPFTIISDKQYLSRIIDNLISNAVKFSPLESTITISITKTENMLVTEVRDEGPGICPEDQERLFKKYEVLQSRPTGGESSTGLGLSITKALVEILNGKIYYKNKKGNENGATFVVELPLQSPTPEL